jgi:hypothetical protein
LAIKNPRKAGWEWRVDDIQVGVLAAIGLAVGIALRPLLRIFVTIPIAVFVAKRIKSERIKRFLFQELDA